METVLQIKDGVYPFLGAMWGKEVRVEEEQEFTRASDLLEKKAEMLKKREIITSHNIIKLLKVYQAETSLRYVYEYVPFSLKNCISQQCKQEEGLQSNKTLFMKKLSCELTMLISEMARLRVDMELSTETIGLTEEERVKIYMPARCRMGNKSEIALLSLYRMKKEKILYFCEQEFARHLKNDEPSANFKIKGNRLLFRSALDESLYIGASQPTEYDTGSNIYSSNVFSSSKLNQSTASCIHPQPNLRHTQSPKFRSKLNFNSETQGSHEAFSSRNGHNSSQKNSFNYRNKKTAQYQDNSDTRSYTHSKSIKIEFEQKVDPFKKKQRKDSVKVKVTTFHEYQLQDCDTSQFFADNKTNNIPFDIQKHFKTEQSDGNDSESSFFDFNPKNRFSRRESTHSSTQPTNTKQKDLEEKVRIAKQKAETLLSRFMGYKKKSSIQ